jgi:NADPH:quinone reductase-like Zn-dependent oxidoreductase
VLKIKNIDKPLPKENEILIRIIATTVNSGDVKMRSKNLPWFFKLPMSFFIGFRSPKKPVLGNTLSGIVEEKGEKVTLFEKGD